MIKLTVEDRICKKLGWTDYGHFKMCSDYWSEDILEMAVELAIQLAREKEELIEHLEAMEKYERGV